MRPSRSGLTFLEVTVVVLIIGILAAIGTPHFARSARTRNARNAAIQLADYVTYVRNVAINEGKTTRLTIDPVTDRFSSPDVDFPDRPGTRISLPVKEVFDTELELSASFDSASALTFDLEGGASISGNPLTIGVISIRSRDIGYRVSIDGDRGTVKIVEVAASAGNTEIAPGGDSLDSGGV